MAISKLPNRKATGPDRASSEHIKFGGSFLQRTWITQIYNAILLLECVPSSFKEANITPIIIYTKEKERILLTPIAIEGSGYPMCSANCLNLSSWLECCLNLKPKVFPQFSKQLTRVVCHVRVLPSPCMKMHTTGTLSSRLSTIWIKLVL